MKKTVGIVSEGPTDYILLKGVIDTITGEENYYIPLQPEANAIGEYGNGWKGVLKWCREHADNLVQYMHAVTPELDFIVIQLDGDVSRKEKEVHCLCSLNNECGLRGKVNALECEEVKRKLCPINLPCDAHGAPPEAYSEHIRSVISSYIMCNSICPVVPCDSTDAWIVAAFDGLADSELIENPWEKVISRSKSYYGIRIPGHKKNQIIYRQMVNQVCIRWDIVTGICKEAARFEKQIKSLCE